VEAVHDARKRLKKTRSLLRLARPGLRKRDYRAQNAALRDAGRALSGARDADVMVETVEKLGERFAGHVPAKTFTAVRDRLAERAADQRADGHGEHAQRLRALAARTEHWSVRGEERDVLVPALRQTYARGRAAFALADAEPTAENLHQWRKRVKDLWYQERLLNDIWPGVMKAQAAEAETLSKRLGDDHDLAVLGELLDADDELQPLIARRRAELLDEVRALGRLIYAERPKAFGRRLARYLEAGRDRPVSLM
jgi:CHAD domain-containing protein